MPYIEHLGMHFSINVTNNLSEMTGTNCRIQCTARCNCLIDFDFECIDI